MTQQTQPIVVTHILPTGTAFGATKGSPPESVFIPGKVAHATDICVGQEVEALLVPNTMQPDRTPWLAAHVSVKPPATRLLVDIDEGELVSTRVRRVMRSGGVWTVKTMFEELFPNLMKEDGIKEYNAISATLRSMFANEECAKFQLWRSPKQSKAGREWFTCYPEKADVDEWVEDAI